MCWTLAQERAYTLCWLSGQLVAQLAAAVTLAAGAVTLAASLQKRAGGRNTALTENTMQTSGHNHDCIRTQLANWPHACCITACDKAAPPISAPTVTNPHPHCAALPLPNTCLHACSAAAAAAATDGVVWRFMQVIAPATTFNHAWHQQPSAAPRT
jgi:hypothetical protein